MSLSKNIVLLRKSKSFKLYITRKVEIFRQEIVALNIYMLGWFYQLNKNDYL